MFKFLSSPHSEKCIWKSSLADFVAFVALFEASGKFAAGNRPATADEIGEVMLQVVDIDISPFPDFRALRLSTPASMEPLMILQRGYDKLEGERLLTNVLEGTGVLLSEEEQLLQLTGWLSAMDFVNKLSKYIIVP